MDARDRALQLVMRGKQIGKSFSYDRDGITFYSTVAIQKRENGYKVQVNEIDEKLMGADVYAREEVRWFNNLNEAVAFIETTTSVKLDDLAPRKGLNWFP